MGTTSAGARDMRVTFQRAAVTRSPLGGQTQGVFADLGSRSAKVLYGTGQERRSAAVEDAVQAATFRLLLDSLTRTITAQDRIVLGALAYDVTGIAPIGRTEIEFTGVASRA